MAMAIMWPRQPVECAHRRERQAEERPTLSSARPDFKCSRYCHSHGYIDSLACTPRWPNSSRCLTRQHVASPERQPLGRGYSSAAIAPVLLLLLALWLAVAGCQQWAAVGGHHVTAQHVDREKLALAFCTPHISHFFIPASRCCCCRCC